MNHHLEHLNFAPSVGEMSQLRGKMSGECEWGKKRELQSGHEEEEEEGIDCQLPHH